MEKQSPPQPLDSPSLEPGKTTNRPKPEIVFSEEIWSNEQRTPEFQSIYRQIKEMRRVLKNRREVVEASEGETFATTTYDNAYRLVSAAYFLLSDADDVNRGNSPSNANLSRQQQAKAEFLNEISQVLDSLGIQPQELRQAPKLPLSTDPSQG